MSLRSSKMPSSMPPVPVDISRIQIPDAEQVCAWLIEHAGLKAVNAPLLLADSVPPMLDPLPPLTERFMRHTQVRAGTAGSDQGLQVLGANPGTLYPFQAIAYACQVPVRLSVGPRNEVETLIERYYGQGRSAMGTLIENLDDEGGSLEDIEHLKDLASEAPVIRLGQPDPATRGRTARIGHPYRTV